MKISNSSNKENLKKSRWTEDDYTLVWNDEFDYEGSPDPSKWTFNVGNHQWSNQELQAYTNRPENAIVKDGKLYIIARKEKDGEREYTSARLTTSSKASWTNGRIAVSAKLPKGKGSWPAIWMLPDDIKNGVSWPLCGEIDIMEHVGREENQILFCLHSDKHNHVLKTHYMTIAAIADVCESFHEYSIEWTQTYVEFFVDDISYAKYSITDDPDDQSELSWPFNKPFFLILNIAVGGGFGGAVDEDTLPYIMEIEYARVYQKRIKED